jgi:Cof subfamily protein (haloacid dehalogenase superfamily)
MTRIALVVSDVDGTLLTKDKVLTDAAGAAVRQLHAAGIGFTIVSSRPTIGMGFLIPPLAITLPIGAFNGSSIVDPQLKPIEQHLIPPATAQRSVDLLNEFGVDIWLFTNEKWLTRRPDGEYVPHEKLAIRADPTIVTDFTPYLAVACKIVGASSDADMLKCCEAAMQQAVGTQATAIRSQSYYLDVTPPGFDKGTFVQAMAKRQGMSTDAVATIGDMQNDLAMFAKSGMSFAMGNATEDVKKRATHVTTSNEDEGFAGAIDLILKNNASESGSPPRNESEHERPSHPRHDRRRADRLRDARSPIGACPAHRAEPARR